MTPGDVLGGLGVLSSVLVGLFVFLGKRGENQVAEGSTKSEADARIDKRQADELTRLYERMDEAEAEIAALKQSESTTRRENGTIRDVVGKWFRELRSWDMAGRRGDMPLPSQPDMKLLDLDPTPADR